MECIRAQDLGVYPKVPGAQQLDTWAAWSRISNRGLVPIYGLFDSP